MAKNNNLSKLWKTEDWLAVWIGFIIIAIGMVAVLAQAFDFSALTFKTWSWGESLTEAQAAKIVPLGQQLAAGAFWIKLLRTVLVLGVLFTVGAALTGEKVKKFIPAFLVVFFLSVVVRLISAEFTLNRYLEWAFWALIVGMLVSNTVGTPKWLKPAVKTEFYIKTGLVIMGFSVLFSNIAKFGLYGLGIAWIVTPVVILFMWWFGTKVLKMDNKPLGHHDGLRNKRLRYVRGHRHGCGLQLQEGRPDDGHLHLDHLHGPDDGPRAGHHPGDGHVRHHGRRPHRRHGGQHRCRGRGRFRAGR